MNFESPLRLYDQVDIEVQLRARRILLSNIVMLLAAPILNLNGNLSIKPDYQLENIVLFLIFTSLVFLVYRDFTGHMTALKSEIHRSENHQKSISTVNKKLLDSEDKYRLLVEDVRAAIFIAQIGLFRCANGRRPKFCNAGKRKLSARLSSILSIQMIATM